MLMFHRKIGLLTKHIKEECGSAIRDTYRFKNVFFVDNSLYWKWIKKFARQVGDLDGDSKDVNLRSARETHLDFSGIGEL